MAKPKRPPGDGMHEVKDGEWVGSIAARYGYADWECDVWRRAENQQLRLKRPDPHVLSPGDRVFVPPWEDKEASASTGQWNKFRLKGSSDVIRLRVLNQQGQPVANAPYQLAVEFSDTSESFHQEGEQTDDEGVLKEFIPHSSTRAVLKLTETGDEIELALGRLEPLDLSNQRVLIKAVQQRLTALGFKPGPIDGLDGPKTQAAVKEFQQYCQDNAGTVAGVIDSGPVDGIVGELTVRALKSYYGC